MAEGTASKRPVAPERAEVDRHLDLPKFRGDSGTSALVFLNTCALAVAWWYLASWLASAGILNQPIAAILLTCAWGLVVLRSFMIFHDCGHGSFFQIGPNAATLNWLALHASAAMCGTPTDWGVGHKLHHANVGKTGQDDYDWGETIFHTASEYLALPAWKQRLWRVMRHPVPFFLLAPALTWYMKMRLPFELRPDRKAAYRFSDKMLSLAVMIARYRFAAECGIAKTVLAGDYLAMLGGVVLFHWQHVFDVKDVSGGYVRDQSEWKIRQAAMQGSSILIVPEALKFFTLGIEYHHIHHFRTRIPGYRIRECHETAPAHAFDDVPVLGFRAMWRALSLQVWDDSTQRYSTFAEVLQAQRVR